MPSSRVDLTANLVDWQPFDNPGYHVHQGRVYLDGRVYSNEGDPAVGQTILSGLPAAIRPAHNVTVTLLADPSQTSWTNDVALQLPMAYAATIGTDGTVRLNAAPPAQINAVPDPTGATYWFWYITGPTGLDFEKRPRYTRPLDLVLCLVASWDLHPIADLYTPQPLAPYLLSAQFEDIDSGYLPHGSRVHLTGHVRAVADGANGICFIPPDAAPGVSPTWDDTTVHGVDGPGGALNLIVPPSVYGPAIAFIAEDEHIKARSEPPAVASNCPTFFLGLPFENVNRNYIGGDLLTSPVWAESGFYLGTLIETNEWDFGQYTCTIGSTTYNGWQGGALDSSYSFSIDALYAMCDPAPEWFALEVGANLIDYIAAQTGCPPDGANGGFEFVNFFYTLSEGTLLNFDDTAISWDSEAGPAFLGGGGWLAPASPRYSGDTWATPSNPSISESLPGRAHLTPLLWQAGQIGSLTIGLTGLISHGRLQVNVKIYPFYEQRAIGVRAGDVIDLTGAGWPGGPTLGSPPGAISASAGAGGIRARGGVKRQPLPHNWNT